MMRALIVSYFAIARKRIQDTVPKSIMHFMVNFIDEQLQNELVRCLYKPDALSELLQEDPSVASQRAATAEMLSALQVMVAATGTLMRPLFPNNNPFSYLTLAPQP